MKDVCPQIVRGKLALGSTLCRFIGKKRRVRDGFTISYKRPLPQHCKSIPHNQVEFRHIWDAINVIIFRDFPAFPGISWHCKIIRAHCSYCNCWNSVAVMLELRCSASELGCSDVDMPAAKAAIATRS